VLYQSDLQVVVRICRQAQHSTAQHSICIGICLSKVCWYYLPWGGQGGPLGGGPPSACLACTALLYCPPVPFIAWLQLSLADVVGPPDAACWRQPSRHGVLGPVLYPVHILWLCMLCPHGCRTIAFSALESVCSFPTGTSAIVSTQCDAL
jgi:hypothetical protein